MSTSHFARRLRVLGAAAAAATVALTATAQADAATQLINAGSPNLAMEVAGDGRVFVLPSNPASFRQQWQRESGINGASRYRNLATDGCLIVPATTQSNADLRVGSCFGVGARNLWTTKNIVSGNGAFMIKSAHNGTVPVPNFFGNPSNVLKLYPESSVSAFGSFLEYRGA